jgi:uncharacterized protein YecT (DUF1311 family)
MKLLLATPLLLLLAFLRAAPAAAELPGPTFDCAKAVSPTETTICRYDPLKVRDWWLDLTYRDALVLDSGHAPAVEAGQRRWLEERNALCGLTAAEIAEKAFHCLIGLYDARIDALTSASLTPVWRNVARDPQAALNVLRPLRGPLARVYADILSHALDKGETLRQFSNFTGDLAEHIGNSSSFWRQGPNPTIKVPCSMVERYPRLLLVGQPYFGNAMDLDLPRLDCAGDSPISDPAGVSRFLTGNPFTLRTVFDRCDEKGGSFFVSLSHYISRLQFRLERFPTSYLSTGLGPTGGSLEESWPETEAIDRADWSGGPSYEDARRSLAAYYTERFNLVPADATVAAARALWDNRFSGDPASGCEGLVRSD